MSCVQSSIQKLYWYDTAAVAVRVSQIKRKSTKKSYSTMSPQQQLWRKNGTRLRCPRCDHIPFIHWIRPHTADAADYRCIKLRYYCCIKICNKVRHGRGQRVTNALRAENTINTSTRAPGPPCCTIFDIIKYLCRDIYCSTDCGTIFDSYYYFITYLCGIISI